MNNKTRKIILGGIVILIIITGFLRDFIFVNTNYALHFLEGKSLYYYGHSNMEFLTNYSISNLYTSKWVFTIIFTIIFMFITVFTITFVFKTKKYTRWILLTYAIIFVIGATTYIGGWVFNQNLLGYTISRVFMGFAQSPIPLMILIPFFYLLNLSNSEGKNDKISNGQA